MSNTRSQFDNYLTYQFSHVKNISTNKHKKQTLSYNYKHILSANLDARILEIGPGYGELLEFLTRDCDYNNVKAIDLSGEVVSYCNQIVPDSTIQVDSSLDFLKQNVEKFDFIFMLQVLEHVNKADVIDLLKAIHQALAPGGKLIVEVPNMANPITGTCIRYGDFTHEVAFTEISLQYVLMCAGFPQITIHELKVPIVSIARTMQAGAQNILNLAVKMANKIYMPRRSQIVSPNIYALAVKS